MCALSIYFGHLWHSAGKMVVFTMVTGRMGKGLTIVVWSKLVVRILADWDSQILAVDTIS